PLEELISKPTSLVIPYLQTSCKFPPCAPTPGTNKKLFGTIFLISAKYSAFVAPTTYIKFSWFFHVLDVSKTCLYNSFPPTVFVWKSKAPSLDVKANIIVCLFSKAKKGSTESLPI